MTEREVEQFRQQLLALGKRINGDMTELTEEGLRKAGGEASGSLSNTPLHLADLGSDTFEHEITLGLLETEGQVLEDISAALERIENGTYGQCEQCGDEIARERLEALPYVEYCVTCANQVQNGSRSPARTT